MKLTLKMLDELAPKFHARVVGVSTLDYCWLWTSYRDKDGYGLFQFRWRGRKRKLRAHRVAYMLARRVIVSENVVIRHRCDTPDCVRPKHLRRGTHADNVADRVTRGRSACGARNKGGRRKRQ